MALSFVTLTPTGTNAAFRDSVQVPFLRHDPLCAAVVVRVGGRARSFSLRTGRELQVPHGQQQWVLTVEENTRLRQALGLPLDLGARAEGKTRFWYAGYDLAQARQGLAIGDLAAWADRALPGLAAAHFLEVIYGYTYGSAQPPMYVPDPPSTPHFTRMESR